MRQISTRVARDAVSLLLAKQTRKAMNESKKIAIYTGCPTTCCKRKMKKDVSVFQKDFSFKVVYIHEK